MDVFNAIYLNETDSIERDFIAVETAFEIAVARANKEYELDSGLISLSTDNLFTEAPDEKRNTTSKSFIQSICDAVSKFFSGIIDTITKIFSGKNEKDFKGDANEKLHLDKDVEKMSSVVDDEMEKGNKLLHKLGTSMGVSDDEIDEWVDRSSKRVKGVAAVAIPIASAFALNKVIKIFSKKKDDKLKEGKDAVGDTSNDPAKANKIKKIFNHLSVLSHEFGSSVKSFGSRISKRYKEANAVAGEEFAGKKEKLTSAYGDEQAKFATGKTSDDEYLANIKALAAKEEAALHEYQMKRGEAASKRDEDLYVNSMYKKVLGALDKQAKKKAITSNKRDSYVELVESLRNKYEAGDIDYKAVVKRMIDLLK